MGAQRIGGCSRMERAEARRWGSVIAATGVTNGSILAGIKREPGWVTTETILMRSKTGSVRRMSYRNPVK